MNSSIKEQLELRILKILKYKNNSSTITSDELEKLVNLYKELNKSNYKKIEMTDLIPCISWLCITAITLTLLLKLL